MDPDQLELLQSTFAIAGTDPDGFARTFYGRLFEVAPGVRPLFPEDLTEQRQKLLRELVTIVQGAAHPERLLSRLRALGARHVGYGAETPHYAVVGEVLLWSLATTCGDAFTDEAREAWTAAYQLIAGIMIEAAEEARGDRERVA